MRVAISKYAGFCFGVDRALKLLDDNVIKNSKKPISMLGQLVHNEQIVNELKKKGVRIVNSLEEVKEGTLVITAHGIDPAIIKKAKKKNLYVIDTTCPMVTKVQKLAEFLQKKGYQVVIFGDKEHMEVKGIAAYAKQPIILESFGETKKIYWPEFKKIGIVSQTTQNVEDFKKLIKYLQSSVKEVKIFDTICASTRGRQEDVKKIACENEVVIVIGSKTSANTKRLYEVAKKINPKTYFVREAADLKKEWFFGIKSAGISAGASTPMWIVREVAEAIKQDNTRTIIYLFAYL